VTRGTHPRLLGVVAGAGYFSQFHFDAWRRIDGVEIVAVCDPDSARAQAAARAYQIPRTYSEVDTMLAAERPDFIDIITPPSPHRALCQVAGDRGVHVVCQKPLAPSLEDAVALVEAAERAGVRLMAHDNFRFQPWHRELKRLVETGAVGRLHAISCRTRMGDGWAPDAYLGRQPYFRTMPRLLVFETGVHFIDVFRYLGGEVREVFARLRRLNQAIAGEDAGHVFFEFESGATGVWDANRYNESTAEDPRYTFGEFRLEGDAGGLRLDEDGRLFVKPLGEPEREYAYAHARRGFAGDCCHAALSHFVERLRDGRPFETDGRAYLGTLAVQEAVYASAAAGVPIEVVPPAR
jgi:predicted dehydrogenase